MNRLLYILIILILTLSSCTKHTEIVYESIDFRDSYWLAYEVDDKKIEEREELFIFHFTESKNLDILLFNLHIPADTRSAFPVISVQSPVSIQCCWQS